MYDKLIKNYSEYGYNISLAPKKNFLTNKINFVIGYELKDKDSIVGYCKIEYTPFKMEKLKISYIISQQKHIINIESRYYIRRRFLQNLERLKKYIVNIKYDKNKIITINEKSNPPIKQRLVEQKNKINIFKELL